MLNPLRDGHIHTPYCPHGTTDALKLYIEKALEKGLKEITFTEHMPLPGTFMDPKILEDSAPKEEVIDRYFEDIRYFQDIYKGKIVIHAGLEVDYVEGYEERTKALLMQYGPQMQDGLLSVHILNIEDVYYCVDYSPECFEEIITLLGGVEKVYDCYYKTVLKAIQADLGPFKPKRIGHPTLVRLFNKRYPICYTNKALLEEVIKAIKEKGYAIDINTAGLRKPFCGEVYPSGLFMELAKMYHIPMVYGSDAHRAQDVGSDFI